MARGTINTSSNAILLGFKQQKEMSGLGNHATRALVRRIPGVFKGKEKLVTREAFEKLLLEMAQKGVDVWAFIRDTPPWEPEESSETV